MREVDLAAKTWTVPGSRMQAGKQHQVRAPRPPAIAHTIGSKVASEAGPANIRIKPGLECGALFQEFGYSFGDENGFVGGPERLTGDPLLPPTGPFSPDRYRAAERGPGNGR